MKKIILFFLLGINICAQAPDPKKILKEVENKFSKVKDYSADASIKLDVPFVKMPDRKVKIYFKQPNKTQFESKEFAMLPKMGLDFNPSMLLKEDYISVYVKQDVIEGKKMDVINLIPQSDTAKVKFIKLWIDAVDKVIKRLETAPDKGGLVTSELSYGSEINYGLPSKMIFSMEFGGVKMPGNMKNLTKKEGEKQENKGSVTVEYSNYQINKGIDDKIFSKKKN